MNKVKRHAERVEPHAEKVTWYSRKQAHFPQKKLGTERTKEAKMATDEILAWVREQGKQDGRRPNTCGRQRTRPNYTTLVLAGVLNSEKCNTNTSTRGEREVSPTAPC